ncbi:MAG: DoxX family protein [Deltaproteobacteria bacterium]|nr:DoxX family protein [Deltaproteobacteria bacterium]
MTTSRLGSPLLLLLRLYFGWNFFTGGKGKLENVERVTGFFQSLNIPFPAANVYLVGTIEMVGGLLLLLGCASRLVSLPLTCVMIVAYATAHRAEAFVSIKAFMGEQPFLYLLTLLFVLAFGPGSFSVDAWIKRRS